jgi:hypothetical protein
VLSSGSGDQLYSPPAVLLWNWIFACWFIGGLFLCLALFLCGKVSDPSAGSLLSACCDGLLFVFNFVELFDFGCCSLAQEMTFVVHYLPYFRQWLITHPVSVLLPFHALFTTISHSYQLLAPVPFSGVLSATLPPPLCASFQFLVYCTFFFFAWGSAQPVAMLVYPRGGWGNTM